MSIITRGQTPEDDALIEQIISDNSDPDLIGTLTEQEQLLYGRELEKIRQGTYTDEDATRLDLADYARQPPSMMQFMEDDYYLGRALRHTEENEGIFPEWKRVLTQDFDRDSKIHNLVITGSLGIGKSWIAVTLLLYRMVCATCLRNPQNFFGLSSGSEMYYLILSVTKEQVKDTAFGDAMNFMAQSAFFVEECKYDPDSQYSRYRIPIRCRLPSGVEANITLIAGSKGQHAIGRNIVAVLLDEGNFRLEENPDLKAYQLYDNVRTRIINRFQKRSGFLPAISIIASSASDESSFTEKIIKEIEEVNDPKTQKIYRYPIYKIKRHTLTLKPWWFKVAYGLKNIEPFVLRGLYRETGEPIPQEETHPRPDGTPMPNDSHEAPPPGARTELVPGDYYEAFRRNARNALQNLAGISVGGSHRLFSSLVDVYWCIQESEKYLPNPHTKEMVPISSEDDRYLWDYLTHSKFLTIVNSKVQPIRHFQHKRYAHLDFAKSGMAGLAICHLAGNQLVTGLVQDGEPYEEYRLIVEYDFIFTIVAGETKDINFEKVLRFFFWLRDTCGYRFGTISADMYQSVMPLQTLEARGFEVEDLSIDRNKAVYDAWRMGWDERRIRSFKNEQMLREAEQLVDVDKKYDHPPDGSKDTTDACAGAFWNAVNSDEKVTLNSVNEAGVYPGQPPSTRDEGPPIEIPIQVPRRRTKIFVG